MSDITMCSNNSCPNAKTCYRIQAEQNPHWQSMCEFSFTIVDDGAVSCEHYIKLNKDGEVQSAPLYHYGKD